MYTEYGGGGLGSCEARGLGQYFGTTPGTNQGPAPERNGEWWQMIPEGFAVWQQLTGGDSGSGACWTGYDNRPFSEPCPDTPDYDAVARAVSRAPEADIGKLIGYLLGANSGRGPKSKGALARGECIPFWVKALMGGKGCVASKYPDAPAWFLTLVRTYGAPGKQEDLQPGTGFKTGIGIGTGAMAPLIAGGLALFFLPKLLGR